MRCVSTALSNRQSAVGTGVHEISAHPALFAIGQNCEGAANLPDGPAVLVGSTRRGERFVDALSADIVSAVADPGYPWGDLGGDPLDGDVDLSGSRTR